MAIHYRTQAFILKKTDLREADQVFTVYTKDFGKLKILGRAIRKIKSKLRSGIGLFYLSEIEFIQGKIYKTLTDAVVIDKFKNIRNDLEKTNVACQIIEVLNDLVKGEEQDEQIWYLLIEVFEKLKIKNSIKIKNWKLEIIYYYFLWNLLSISGYQVDLYKCANCEERLVPQRLYFNVEQGGIVCCTEGESISPEIVKILRLFLKKDWNTLSRLRIRGSHKRELESILTCFLDKIIV